MEQMLAMECSEEESAEECVRNEEWENENQNQMDFELESADDVVEDALTHRPTSEMDMSNSELSRMISAYKTKKGEYEGILKNQVENIIDLQTACEKVACIVEQLPILKEQNSLRFNQVMVELHDIREKHRQLNELIEFTVQIYDDTMAFIQSVKESFCEQQRMNDERFIVLDMDVQEFPKMGNTLYNERMKRIKKKRDYCWLLNNYLAEVTKSEITLKELDMKIGKAFVEANDLNNQLLECESQLEIHIKSKVQLSGELQNEKTEFFKKMDELVESEKECTEELVDLKNKIGEDNCKLQMTLNYNIQLENEATSAQEKRDRCENEKQEKDSVRSSLELALEDLTNQEKTLTESLPGLERRRQMVVMAEEEVESLEDEFQQQWMEYEQLNEKCNKLERQIVEFESLIGEVTGRRDQLKQEYEKISPDVESLRATLHRGRTELESSEKKLEDELIRVQSEVDQMNQKLSDSHGIFEEYKKKFVALQHHKDEISAIVKEKSSSIARKEECMHSVNEELEECKVEFSDLSEQKKNAMELKNQVSQLNNELRNSRKELALLNEGFSMDLTKINETNNKKIEEAMKEMESKQQDYLATLEEKMKEINALEEEFKVLQRTATTSRNMLKDATKQVELFSCEQSLLSTFAKWVFEEGPFVPDTEPWVTSTSDNPLVASEFVNNSLDESDFEVKEIKSARNS